MKFGQLDIKNDQCLCRSLPLQRQRRLQSKAYI